MKRKKEGKKNTRKEGKDVQLFNHFDGYGRDLQYSEK